MKVTVWSYTEQLKQDESQIQQLILDVMRSGQLILGEQVRLFEEEFSTYCNQIYGVGVNSGTDAIFLGLKALGVGQGDEVITVSNTAVPTVSAIVSTGAKPVFVDICPNTYLMDTTKIEQMITPKTKCILPVHLFGQCVDMSNLNKIAQQYNLSVLEDCAQAHGAKHQNQMAGSMSDISSFSFYPTKLLGTYGDGGMVLTNSESLAQKLKRLRFYGMDKQYYANEHGYNSRLDEMQAAILRFRLTKLNDYIELRKGIAARYDERLNARKLVLPQVADGNSHAYYLYVCRHPNRDKIIEELKKKDIHVNISYPWPIHTMKAYVDIHDYKNSLKQTEMAANEIFSLPMYPELEIDKQDFVIESLNQILKEV